MDLSDQVAGDAITPDNVVGIRAGLSTAFGLTEVGVDSPRSDVAQQRSASDWLMPCVEPEECLAAPCIGHSCSLAQQSMRASAVESQPWHSAR
jgi:hypothetical protein